MSNITASIDHATGLTSAQLDAVVRALMFVISTVAAGRGLGRFATA